MWKPLVERRAEQESRRMNRNSDNIVYLIEKMENSQNLQYNPNKTFHENLQEHQDGKKLLEEADNQNFLK